MFKIGDFNTKSAVEAAAMYVDAKRQGDKKGGSESIWQRVKVDRQIVAIAKANSADLIYTNDAGLKTFAKGAGIKTVSLWELSMPPPTQVDGFIEG